MKDISGWIWGNILWEILAFAIIVLLPTIIRAFKIAHNLLDKNRSTMNNGWGTHYADRFVNIWNTSKELPLRYGTKEDQYQMSLGGRARHSLNLIDDKLVELGLIECDQTHREWSSAKPIRSFRNRIVYFIVKDYLIRIIGDNPQYYVDQEGQRGLQK